MASVLENAYFRHRLRQMDQLYPEPSTFGNCDFTSCMYFGLSMILLSVGTVITIFALSGADNFILSNLGHMWIVGPIFMSSGLMVGVKSVLYLRRKSVIQMLLRQRALLRGLQELAHQSRQRQQQGHAGCVVRNESTSTLPPAYEALNVGGVAAGSENSSINPSDAPPPTYDEAVFLMGDEKLRVVLEEAKTASSMECYAFKEEATPSSSSKP